MSLTRVSRLLQTFKFCCLEFFVKPVNSFQRSWPFATLNLLMAIEMLSKNALTANILKTRVKIEGLIKWRVMIENCVMSWVRVSSFQFLVYFLWVWVKVESKTRVNSRCILTFVNPESKHRNQLPIQIR